MFSGSQVAKIWEGYADISPVRVCAVLRSPASQNSFRNSGETFSLLSACYVSCSLLSLPVRCFGTLLSKFVWHRKEKCNSHRKENHGSRYETNRCNNEDRNCNELTNVL